MSGELKGKREVERDGGREGGGGREEKEGSMEGGSV